MSMLGELAVPRKLQRRYFYHAENRDIYSVWLGVYSRVSRHLDAVPILDYGNLNSEQKQQLREAIAAYDADHGGI